MVSRIRVLDEQTINQIAAGEVIENPASVVKELVENAIDALSTEICVEIKGGGRQLIRITDDGIGMNADDAVLCLERHATSKIKDVEDIHAILTMGFRGEAIPSIASISKFTLITCPRESKNHMGTMVIVDGGKIFQCAPAARSPGTTIEVKSLFFNVPVRKKFQRSPAYDANEIMKMLSNIALGHPEIKFQLISDQKTLLNTAADGGDFIEFLGRRAEAILGDDFNSAKCIVDIKNEEYKLQGFIGSPSYSRHNRTGQYLFINKRAVVSPLISYAVRDAYATTLSSGRHPVFVLHLTMSGDLVDVNVHPQKREVRLRQEQALRELVMQGVRRALQKREGSFEIERSFEPIELPTPPIEVASKESFLSRQFIEKPSSHSWGMDEKLKISPLERPMPVQTEAPREPSLLLGAVSKVTPKILTTIKQYILVDAETTGDLFYKQPREGLCLIDQKAAHSRVIFEKLCQQKLKRNQLPVQSLLIPQTFDVTPVEAAQLLENLNNLNHMGIGIRRLGTCTFVIDAIPYFFGNADIQSLLTEMVHSIREFQDGDIVEKEREKLIAIAASRASVSNGKKMSLEEAQGLINQLILCEMPSQCPLGKPTWILIGQEELSKKFKKLS